MAAQVFLGNIFAPVGILIDRVGNTYVNTDTGTGSILTKIAPNGSILGQVSLSTSFFDIASSVKLAIVSSGGNAETILALRPDGLILAINPNTLAVQPFLNLRGLNVNASTVFDIMTGSVENFSGFIQTQSSTYGDIAVRQSGTTTEIYVTGLAQAQTLPFVARVEIQNNTIQDADVLMTSRADAFSLSPQTPRLERGIAVNAQGVVLTTLPVAIPPNGSSTPLQPFDVPVGFLANFDPTDGVSQNEAPAIFSNIDIYSQGMTTDAAGNFYIATNSVGSAALGVPGEGALISISSDLDQLLRVEGLGLPASTFRDVAINPLTQQPLVTVSTFSVGPVADDLVVSFSPNPAITTTSVSEPPREALVTQTVITDMTLAATTNEILNPSIPEAETALPVIAGSGFRNNVLGINEELPFVSPPFRDSLPAVTDIPKPWTPNCNHALSS